MTDDLNDGPLLIGWRELVDLPEWGLRGIRAKIDTGARTSALHVAEFEILAGDRVRFEVVAREKPERKTRWVEAPLVRHSIVKPSSGERQERPVVSTRLRIGNREHEAEISLVCRKGMLCRMLVGRTALAGTFVVDPGARRLASHLRPTSKRSASP